MVEGSEDGGVVFFEEAFGLAAELDEVGSGLLDWSAEFVDVDGVWGNAGEDELCEECVDVFGGAEVVELRDLLVEIAHFLDQRVSLANHVDTLR